MTFGGFLGSKSITIVEVDELNGKKMKSLKHFSSLLCS